MRGQVTLEFMLMIVVLLAFFGSVTQPFITDTTNGLQEAATATMLATAQQRIINTAEQVSQLSCGASTRIAVTVPSDEFTRPNVTWNPAWAPGKVAGGFLRLGAPQANYTEPQSIPTNIKIEEDLTVPASAPNYFIKISKDCSSPSPTAFGAIGYGYEA
jgi:hypothetical protein